MWCRREHTENLRHDLPYRADTRIDISHRRCDYYRAADDRRKRDRNLREPKTIGTGTRRPDRATLHLGFVILGEAVSTRSGDAADIDSASLCMKLSMKAYHRMNTELWYGMVW